MKKIFLFALFLFSFSITPLAFAGGDVSISAEDISFSPSPTAAGQALKIYATVHNNSKADMMGIVKIFDEFSNQDIGSDIPFSTVAGAINTVFTTAKLDDYGSHTIAVRVIPFDTKGDKNNNNKAYKKIFVDTDFDQDGIGDTVDPDYDGDGINNDQDAFSKDPKEWLDTEKDGIGNNADLDDDNDGHPDLEDELPLDSKDWKDTDADGTGDNSDTDIDGDGILNDEEVLTDPLKTDTDGDGINDKEDKYPLDSKRNLDSDKDGVSNFDDSDDDNDRTPDNKDAFPFDPKESLDSDGDGIGNNADLDDDNDGWSDDYEIKTSKTNSLHADSDKDGILDPKDIFPMNPKEWADNDKDGLGDNADLDDDNDGHLDAVDAFLNDPKEWLDTDKDGIGNNADADDDNDDISDDEDVFPLDSKESKDSDGDGLGDNADPNDHNKGPVIQISAPDNLKQGQLVAFSNKSSFDPDGVITAVEWKSDEGQIATGDIFSPVFHKAGKHLVSVKMTDDQGEPREKNIEVMVQTNWTPYIAGSALVGLMLIFFILQKRKRHKWF